MGRAGLGSKVLSIAAFAMLATCTPAPKEDAAADAPVAKPLAPGRAEYDRAKSAIVARDMPRAIELLTQATRADAEVCEYWYDLGAAESNRAIDVVYDSSSDAVHLFESSVDHKTESLRLMDLGKCAIWTGPQRQEAHAAAVAGLRDADEVLRDKASLVAALQMYADQRQQRR
jgi:hypothetical protein